LFEELLPNLRAHFNDEGLPDLLWITKWFQSCFLYSFPLGLCLRIWDNIFAYGSRFILSTALAILKLIESNLQGLSLGDINDFFKQLKDDDGETTSFRLLPDFETIIKESRRINITDERIESIMNALNLSGFKSQISRDAYIDIEEPLDDITV